MTLLLLAGVLVAGGADRVPGLHAQSPVEAVQPGSVQADLHGGVDPVVDEQVRAAERAVAAAIAARADSRTVSEAYGALARVQHVYELFEEAEASYRAALERRGDDRWSYLLGYLYQQTGRFDLAATRLVDVRRSQPANHPATIRLGQVYLGLGRLREAREEFERVIDTFPALAHQGLGEVALRERRFADAAGHFREALGRVPQATSLHYPLAMAYRGLGQLDRARAELARRGAGGLRLGDPLVDALQELVRGERGLVMQGRRAYESGQFAEAASAFQKAVTAAPTSAAARFNLGLAVLQLGDTALGIAHLRAALALQPDDTAMGRELARVLMRAGLRDEAATVLAGVVDRDPLDADSVVALAILLADRERYREAIALLSTAADRSPAPLGVATTLARLLASAPDLSLRDGQRALALASRVHEAEATPAHAETVAMALAELSRCVDAAGWISRAVADAGRLGEVAEVERLKAELPRYQSTACRRP